MSKAKLDALFLEAQNLEDEGKIQEALWKLDEIHAIDKRYDKAWAMKFKILYQHGQIDKSAICARNAVLINPAWVKWIRQVEAAVQKAQNKQYAEIPLTVPKTKRMFPTRPSHKPAPVSKTKEQQQAESSAMLFGIIDNMATTIDGTSVTEANGGSLAYVKVGQMTQHLDGKGPHRITDPETKEEWIIERNGVDIVTHAHTGPKKLKDKSLMEVPGVERLMLALMKLAQSKKAYKKVSQEELQKILQHKAQDSSEENPPTYSRKRSRFG